MGVAVLEDGALLYHGVEGVKNLPSPHDRLRQCRQAVIRLIEDFRPKVIAVEKAFFANNKNAALLNVLVDEIGVLARRRGISLLSFAPSTVKKIVSGNGWATKDQVARVIAARYPELKAYLSPQRRWKQRRHLNMFDAVALGVAYFIRNASRHAAAPSAHA